MLALYGAIADQEPGRQVMNDKKRLHDSVSKLTLMLPDGIVLKINELCEQRRIGKNPHRFKRNVVVDAINMLYAQESSE